MIDFKNTRELTFLGIGILMSLLTLFIIISSIKFLVLNINLSLEQNRGQIGKTTYFNVGLIKQLEDK
ncbi:MAG: hypothetical protein PHN74_03185 [Candidatus Pacebacteria bacterium]|nr:hypothetical protein [Candidatus Paceibacterota bacterium]